MGLRAALLAGAGIIVVIIVVAGFLYGLLPGRANLINGSFENVNRRFESDFSVNVPCKNLKQLSGGNRDIAGWKVVGATGLQVAWRGEVPREPCNIRASDGTLFIDLANDNQTTGPTAGVEQVVQVTRPGVFELNLDVGAKTSAVGVEVRVEDLLGRMLVSKTCPSTPAGSGVNWQPCTLPTFTAEKSPISAGGTGGSIKIVIRGPSQGSTAFIGVDNVVLRGQ